MTAPPVSLAHMTRQEASLESIRLKRVLDRYREAMAGGAEHAASVAFIEHALAAMVEASSDEERGAVAVYTSIIRFDQRHP